MSRSCSSSSSSSGSSGSSGSSSIHMERKESQTATDLLDPCKAV